MERSIVINGRPKRLSKGSQYRHLITISGVEILLTFIHFKYMTKLANRRQSEIADGWLHHKDLAPDGHHHQYLYNLRQSLAAAGAEHSTDTLDLIERDRNNGTVRLAIPPKLVTIKWRILARLGDHELSIIADQCRKREQNLCENSLTTKIKG